MRDSGDADGRDPDVRDDPTLSDGTAEITRLDDRTVREIAAGEVVERPASVVKELVENALDAGAERVAVAVENGGLDGVRVSDDGHGMTPEQLPRAVDEHTTSKLGGIDDLDRGIATLGFRGEALYTVGAVAELTLRSRPPDRETGAELVVDHGDHGEVRPVGCPVGTTVEVRELFAETPARRKFLKTPATEFDRVNAVVSAYALANPDVAVSLEHDDREVFASPGDGDRRSAVLAVYGRPVAESMIDVERRVEVDAFGAEAGADETPATVSVTGLVSDPETTRASREYVTTFVNGRWVRDADLRSAVVDAYGGQLAADRYPFAVLFVDAPPAAVDANVHPRKTEVRFDDAADVLDTVRTAVRESLLDAGLLRTSAPRGRSAPAETELDPEVVGGAGPGDEVDSRADSGTTDDSTTDDEPKRVEGDDSGGGSDDESSGVADPDDAVDTSATDSVLDAWDDSSAADDAVQTGDSPATRSDDSGATDSGGSTETTDRAAPSGHGPDGDAPHAEDHPSPRRWQADADGEADDGEGDGSARSPTAGLPAQATLSGGTTDEWSEYDTLPDLRVLGQYDDTYLVCETAEGLVLVDQHAADERVNYERLREAVDDAPAQALADPVELDLTAREAALFDRFRDALAAAGFGAERRDDRTVAVTAVPAVFDAALAPELLRDTLAAFAEDVAGSERPVETAADDLLSDLACYPSITGNTSLTDGSVADLLDALDDCENPYACPHGRPVLVEFGGEEIEARFERDYPGHGERRE